MITVLGVIFGVGILAAIVGLLLKHKLREKYAVLWLIIGLAILVLTLFPSLLIGLASVLGIAVPSNLLFILAIALLVGVTLHQSWELSATEDETRRVAEEVAILRAEIEALRGANGSGAEDEPRGSDV
ncbi:DUF2304 domain-containing protein [Microbacterium sp. 22303]|uniref:DUF2304 domain-containing protein n=1 Tax=Microbacterium sp. 22303 TaxID=3453905 RepID=UPI003F842262